MKNAWIVRPFPHEIKRLDEFKANNLVAVGWPGIGDLSGKTREDIKSILSDVPYSLSSMALGNAYATIDIFVNRMRVGDFLLIPDGDDIYFAEVAGAYNFDKSVDNCTEGYPHQRKVKWLSNVSRNDLSAPLRSSLKVHRATADLSKHYDEIDALAHGYEFHEEANTIDTLSVSYPLRSDFSVYFEIPANITKDEAKRLRAYFKSLYFTE